MTTTEQTPHLDPESPRFLTHHHPKNSASFWLSADGNVRIDFQRNMSTDTEQFFASFLNGTAGWTSHPDTFPTLEAAEAAANKAWEARWA